MDGGNVPRRQKQLDTRKAATRRTMMSKSGNLAEHRPFLSVSNLYFFTGPIVKLKLQPLSIAFPLSLSPLVVGRGREVISFAFGRVQQRAEKQGARFELESMF